MSAVFFCSRLSVRLGKFYCAAYHHLCLPCWYLLWNELRSSCFRFLLSGYLAKLTLFDETSSPDKRGLTVCLKINSSNPSLELEEEI